MFVVDGLNNNLLGLTTITALGLAVRVDTTETEAPIPTPGTTADFMKQFPSVLQGLGNLGEQYEIHLKSGATLWHADCNKNQILIFRAKKLILWGNKHALISPGK